MRLRPVFAVLVCLLAVPAFAQDDDLAPLAPTKPKPAPAKPKPAPAKPKPAPVAKPKPVAVDDDLAPLAPVAPKQGELSVKLATAVSGASVSIDGKELASSAAAQSLPPGEHTVQVRRPGYAVFVKKVTVVAGRPVEVSVSLVATAAVLSVTSDVSDAQVFVNGRQVGTAPLRDLEVPPGSVEISVRKAGFKEDKQRLTLLAGKDYPVQVKFNPGALTAVAVSDRPVETDLTPGPTHASTVDTGITTAPTVADAPIYQRWYFWAGVAAVVVAAGVGVAVGVNASQTQKLQEGNICYQRDSSGKLTPQTGGTCSSCIGLACSGAGILPANAPGVMHF
jgi:hypothetical protein